MITRTLRNKTEIPLIALGTWKSSDEEAYKATKWALEAGYRHIDTAAAYGNEAGIGKAIKESGIPREEIFVTTKLWNTDQGYEETKKACQESLDKLGIEYVDLYLIHWFKGYDKAKATWKAMEELYEDGFAKAIGVSNYNVHHIQFLLDNAKIAPMVNQVETHIELQNHFLQEFCEKHDILLEAYAPFMSWRVTELLENETIQPIAKKYDKTIPQVVLRWFVQRGIVALPKSVHKKRIEANIDVFDFTLSDEEMKTMNGLNKGNKMFPEFDNVTF